MKYVNGFFRLIIRENGVYAHIFPEKPGGKKISVQEFAAYLEACGVQDYDLTDLNRRIGLVKEECDVYISSAVIPEVDEKMNIRVTEDKMMAVVRFYPPSKNGKLLTEQDIRSELKKNRITYGISDRYIKAYLMGRQFCRDIPIAKGKPVVPGQDARVSYHFATNPVSKPKLLEDGSVDFHELNMFTNVKKGDLLAELIPDVPGQNGMDIYGNVIKAPNVRKEMLRYGRNISVSDDKLRIYSDVDGDVRLEGDTVFVSNTYQVAADVDASTGDSHYDGNVVVSGSVRSGFCVEAAGDIEVNGAVEGATLIAGGNIVLKRGVQGMQKASLQAGGDIVTKFIENSKARAGHTINTGFALHSELVAHDSVIVSGKKGFLIGGTISAGSVIEASVLGNKMNTATTLKVGVEPEVLEHFKELSALIKESQEKMLEQQQILDTLRKKIAEGRKLLPNQLTMAKEANENLKTLEQELDRESSEYMTLKDEIENHKGGKVIVHSSVYPGVSIYISNRFYPVKSVQSMCQFRLEGADVVFAPI